jgi:hypothetical protein
MLKTLGFAALTFAAAATAGAAINVAQPTFEEIEAHHEEARIFQRPIAGIENHYWFDYRTDVNEARKELAHDIGRATDMEDLRDGWEEYRGELAHGRTKYVKQMAKRGYRAPTVEVVD